MEKDVAPKALTIGGLAMAGGVTVETVRFYQRKGLLPLPHKPYGGIRHYGGDDVARMRFVKSARQLGFSLDQIADLLRLEDGTHCEEASRLAQGKLLHVRAKLAELTRIETALSALLSACRMHQGNVSCPLIASLHGDHAPTHNGHSR